MAAEEPGSRQFVESNLQRVGHTVVTTAEMATALEIAKTERVDLVVVDAYAPTQTPKIGCETVRAIRADPSLAHLPVILLWPRSAREEHLPWNWCDLAQDACTYLPKPPNPVELWAVVDDPQPGDHLQWRLRRYVYRPGDWPEIEEPKRRPWWRWWPR